MVKLLFRTGFQSQPTLPNHPSFDFARRGLGVRFPSSPLPPRGTAAHGRLSGRGATRTAPVRDVGGSLPPLPGVRTRVPVGTISTLVAWTTGTVAYRSGAVDLWLVVRRHRA
jgi:hypothetical protein